MADFVQGPWEVSEHTQNVCAANSPDNGGNIICQAPRGFISSLVYWEANARLIAIAPEMYAKLNDLRTLLEESLVYLDFEVDEMIFKQAIKDIESLLAKAEGKKEASHG